MIELYDVHALWVDIQVLIDETWDNVEYEHGFIGVLDTISPGDRGIHQIEDAIDLFELDIEPEDEWAWNAVDEVADRLADELTVALHKEYGLAPEYFLSFGNHEYLGDYELELWVDATV